MGWDIQQVCIKCGRQITGALKTYKNGEDFCTKCGGETTSKCSNCGTEIQGNFVHDLEGRGSTPPRNCSKCGKPFPWAAKERLEESDLIKHKMELATAQANEDSNRKHAEDIRKMIKERISNTAKTVPTNPPLKAIKEKVFVVHGRNIKIKDSMFDFLKSVGLEPIEWSEAVAATGKASPYVGEVLDKAFEIAQVIVVLFTPDDEAKLKNEFHLPEDLPHERNFTPQARPNVIFEAGMAMGRAPDRTIMVELGRLRPFSDVGGRHVVKIGNTNGWRRELIKRLQTAQCPINLSNDKWESVGDFSISEELTKVIPVEEGSLEETLDFNWSEKSDGSYRLFVENVGTVDAENIYIEIETDEFLEEPSITLEEGLSKALLQPGDKFIFGHITFSAGSSNTINVKLFWEDSTGEKKELKKRLSPQ